jgi:hypothetical protein
MDIVYNNKKKVSLNKTSNNTVDQCSSTAGPWYQFYWALVLLKKKKNLPNRGLAKVGNHWCRPSSNKFNRNVPKHSDAQELRILCSLHLFFCARKEPKVKLAYFRGGGGISCY